MLLSCCPPSWMQLIAPSCIRFNGASCGYSAGLEDAVLREEVGVRELGDHLSRYLERGRAGAGVVVIEHGVRIAYLVPRPRCSKLAEMIATGRAGAPITYRRGLPEPVDFAGTGEELDQLIRDSR